MQKRQSDASPFRPKLIAKPGAAAATGGPPLPPLQDTQRLPRLLCCTLLKRCQGVWQVLEVVFQCSFAVPNYVIAFFYCARGLASRSIWYQYAVMGHCRIYIQDLKLAARTGWEPDVSANVGVGVLGGCREWGGTSGCSRCARLCVVCDEFRAEG
jgi:hypothetical protein